jgi:hypothetical protein
VPKMFIHAPSGVFSPEARARVAAELTNLGMACELPRLRSRAGRVRLCPARR